MLEITFNKYNKLRKKNLLPYPLRKVRACSTLGRKEMHTEF
jgi:hypothetical protein